MQPLGELDDDGEGEGGKGAGREDGGGRRERGGGEHNDDVPWHSSQLRKPQAIIPRILCTAHACSQSREQALASSQPAPSRGKGGKGAVRGLLGGGG